MSSSSPLKVGVVGLSTKGWASVALGPSLVQPSLRDKYSLVAVSTTSEASAAASARKWSDETGNEVKAYHGDVSNLLSGEKDLDLVVVSVKAAYHKDALLPAIRAKKDVFVEWPAGKNAAETRELAAEANKAGVKALVGLQGRQSPVLAKVKEIIDSGKIGKVLSSNIISTIPAELQAWGPMTKAGNQRFLEKELGTTALSIVVGHQLDAVDRVLGKFVSVSATGTTHYPTTSLVDDETGEPTGEVLPAPGNDHFSITATLESGSLFTSFFRTIKASTPGRLIFLWEIDGEEGSIKMSASPNNINGSFFTLGDPELYVNGEKVEVEGAQQGPIGSLVRNWEEFAKGEKGSYATLEDAVRIKDYLDAVETSLETGVRISVRA
ncbi:NAD-binding Rossmann fold oxidoreductase [Coprinopsis cinerea okayama7|uniref:NAD-binding Rossmann fold oxidoreductase n=1 Tax=Coprinopsis cinerea (strain Okayama-7 / 130 / ATCC MYA-4618 / FGSC 9003) TaxID=240176 RepID=A8NPI5_COPC7|nr:NAD-binding Rossmann fold oxidoreductase [Coprinopsis cinerea okayama7\|eukprot:XP_001835343.1 NAD-binding Rossmann fold oxidoreductase [Coprinopsis cinerea okayama7\